MCGAVEGDTFSRDDWRHVREDSIENHYLNVVVRKEDGAGSSLMVHMPSSVHPPPPVTTPSTYSYTQPPPRPPLPSPGGDDPALLPANDHVMSQPSRRTARSSRE